ncbi:Ig-like domain-containing protein [Pseudomonas sp. M30-35]|uniref:Ig-like domain-containing protein n=1 Tax=Pseudomonas sp. M30-35 TaxID=1981174 RepID=UPI000B3CF712|nr:Ig-like domain-containing protein [Pseudomonas sp. M30-35]ARU90158.1 hypothetical protein B9K09_20360 [Pseudomonas sp. M30-35]
MESKAINLVVVDGKKISKTVELTHGDMSGPVTIEAVEDGKYLLAEQGSGVAPENITVKRVGDDLYISLEGEDTDNPQVIISDYYLNESELIGKGEDGAYYSYVTSLGQDSAVVTADTAEPLALGKDSIPDFAEGLIAENDDDTMLWALLGLGALALVGGGIAIANNNDGGGHHSSSATSAPVVTVSSGTLDSATDDVGSTRGVIADGSVTDDSRPTFAGSGVTPGDIVVIIDNGNNQLGTATAQADGTWSFTPDTALTDGEHAITVVAVDSGGNASEPSNAINVIVDTVAPAAAGSIVVEEGTNTPTITGDAEAGTVVIISDNGKEIGSAQVDENGKWSFTPETPLADGDHDISVVVEDDAGNVSPEADVPVTIAPDNGGGNDNGGGSDALAPSPAENVTIADDAGNPINNGETNDNTPVISGDAEAGSVVIVSDNGEEIGSVQVDENGKWNFTPTDPIADGEHIIDVVVVDDAGNKSQPTDDIPFTVDTLAPDVATGLALNDDVGEEQGLISENGVTDDALPTFSGSAEPNAVVTISDHGDVIGSVQVKEDGTWDFTPETALADGDHSFTTVVKDSAGNQSASSPAFDFTVDTSTLTPSVASGTENFETTDKFQFAADGDSVTLASGVTMTLVSGPTDGQGQNAYTEISSKGLVLFAPEELGKQALMVVQNSEVRIDFGGTTNSVSFDVNASSFPGSTVSYYDANGEVMQTQYLPVQTDGAVQTMTWTAPEGQSIASIAIDTGAGSGSNVITRFDNFVWGTSSTETVEATHEVTPEVQSLTHQFMTDTGFDYSLDNQLQADTESHAAQQGIIDIHDAVNLSIDELLSAATKNLFIDDGKEQIVIGDETGSNVDFDIASFSGNQGWDTEGQVTAGGVVYDVYQQHESDLELLIQHA